MQGNNKTPKTGYVLPIVVDTLNGRDMRISPIVMSNYDSLSSPRSSHLLSPENQRKLKELPF